MIYDVPAAKTAADVYMRRLLGNVNESFPLPTNKVEVFLYLLCGGDYNMPQPITSEERFLAYMLGVSGVTLPTPQTRLETYMDKVCRRGSNAVVPPKTRYELYWWLWSGITEITSTSLPVIFQTSLPYLRNYQIYGNTNSTRPNAIDSTQWTLQFWHYDNGLTGHEIYGAATDYMLYGGAITVSFANPPRAISFVYFDSDKNFISRSPIIHDVGREITNEPPDSTAYFKIQVTCRTYQTITDEYIENLGVVLTTQFITPDSPAIYSFVGDKTVNLFDINGSTSLIYDDCHIQDDKFIISSIGNGATSRIYWRNVYPAGTYFITAKFDGGVSDVRFYSPTPFNGASYNSYYQGWFRVIGDGIAVTFEQDFTVGFIANGPPQSYGEVYGIQIQNGIMGTNFEPYGKYKIPITMNGETETIYVDRPILAIQSHLEYADYIDYKEQKIVRNIGEFVIDENAQRLGFSESHQRIYISYKIPGVLNDHRTEDMCDKLYYSSSTADTSGFEGFLTQRRVGDGSDIGIFIPKKFLPDTPTEQDVNTFLRPFFPLKFYLPLSTPTTETIELPQFATQDGNNTFTFETTIPPTRVIIEA